MFPILLANFISTALTPRSPPRRRPPPGRVSKGRAKPINLALQGGGAHGAFTWGVLDQLLDDGRIGIEGISGASAGAVNAVMLADGLTRGGPDEARQRLADFWRAVSVDGHLGRLQRSVVERLFPFVPGNGLWFTAMSRMLSPYDLNPLNINPLKELIEHAPSERAVRAAALQGEIDPLGATLPHSPRRRHAPRRTARRERVGNEICEQNGKHSPISMRRGWCRDSHNVGMILLHCNIKLWQCTKSKKCSKRVRSEHVEIENVASVVESRARRLPISGP